MYRYSQQLYNSCLLNMGGLRIGTLHDFRRQEHARGIADVTEGKKRVRYHMKNLHDPDPAVKNANFAFMKAYGLIGGDLNNILMEDNVFFYDWEAPDCYILCTSKKHSRSTMAEFDGADSCVSIADAKGFYEEITRTLTALSPVVFRGAYFVEYQDKLEEWNRRDWGKHPAIVKDPCFKRQAEIRAIWQPRFGQPVIPINIMSYRLSAFCDAAPF